MTRFTLEDKRVVDKKVVGDDLEYHLHSSLREFGIQPLGPLVPSQDIVDGREFHLHYDLLGLDNQQPEVQNPVAAAGDRVCHLHSCHPEFGSP